MLLGKDVTSLPNAPVRKLTVNDRALLKTTEWVKKSELRLEDRVSLAHRKAVFLQGVVAFVGEVHFDEGVWVGIQLTGPSVGRGDCDGTFKGRKYFAKVGKNNGVMAPLNKVTKREEYLSTDGKPQYTEEARMKAMSMVDILTDARAAAILQDNERKNHKYRYHKDEAYVERLRQSSLSNAIKGRSREPIRKDLHKIASHLKYSGPEAELAPHEFDLAEGLEMTKQNYCLSDPTLPDNPITFASQPFLNMTGYQLSEILGRNCRFLQGNHTDKYHVDRVRMSIAEGADCHVCLLNYRKDGTPFYNRLFMTALRDTKGRIKNYLGVQCEVSKAVADKINGQEKQLYDAGMKRHGTQFAKGKVRKPDEASLGSSQRSDSSGGLLFADMTMEEALLRATMDDPWGPLSAEDEKLLKASNMDPYTGYSSSTLNIVEQDGKRESISTATMSSDEEEERPAPKKAASNKAPANSMLFI